jgi:flagellar export protein FliJ
VKRFHFPLARLERVRGVRRRQARAALGAASAELRASRERLEAAAAALARSGSAAGAVEDSHTLKQLAAWREELHGAHARAAGEERKAAAAVARALSTHTEAARAHRVLERLEERARTRWLEAAEIEERKFLDETHLLRRARERSGLAATGEGEAR